MKTEIENLIAAGCGLLYLLAFLFLPFIAVVLIGIGANGVQLLRFMGSIPCLALLLLPVLAGIAMIICSIMADSRTAVIVAICSAFVPLIVFFIVQGSLINDGMNLVGLTGILGNTVSTGLSGVLTVGIGVVLDIFLGIGCAVACIFAGKSESHHTSNRPVSGNDEW